jgi:hypothetical protein
MTKLIKLLRPLNNLIWDYLVKNKFILFCGGGSSTVIEAPKPVNVEESMRDYLEAITDPELLNKQIDAEKMYGPQFDSVSLARTQTMLEGMNPKESLGYAQAIARKTALQANLAALQSGDKKKPSNEEIRTLIRSQLGPRPGDPDLDSMAPGSFADIVRLAAKGGQTKKAQETYDKEFESLVSSYSAGWKANSIADVKKAIQEQNEFINRIESMPEQKGILEMAEDAAIKMQDLQDRIDTAKRTGDISDLQNLGPGLVEALRKADPQSTTLADASAQIAEQAQTRALEGVEQTDERIAMGEIAQQGRDRIAQLEALEAEARTPAENQELQNLKDIRDQQAGMFAQAQARAEDPRSIQERATMGMLGDAATIDAMRVGQDPSQFEEFQNLQQLGDMGMLSAKAAQFRAMDPNLAEGRAEMGQLADLAQAQALDPISNAERAALGDMAEESRNFASQLMQEAQNPALPNEERQRLIAMSQQQQARADDIYARAGEVSPEQEALRNQASAMQQRAQGLFAQAEAAPSQQKQQLQAAAMDMMERGKGLFEQAATPSSARQAAGSLAQLSAEQARQLSADALGPLSAQRRRMAEQAARQQGLRTGRIGDQMQLASELLNREEQRAALRAEAREAQDLAYRQAAGFATDLETDAERLRQQALGFETGGFDRARGVEGDIDAQRLALLQEGRLTEGQAFDAGLSIEGQISDQELARLAEGRATAGQSFDMGRGIQSDLDTLTAQRRAQALAAQGDARSATTDLLGIDKGFRDEAFDRQQALIDADEGFREEARLERAAAEAQQQGLLDEARTLRDEAATRRSEAIEIQQGIAEFDAGLRAEAQQALSAQGQMSAGILSAEEALKQQARDEAAGLRGEISQAEQTAFARQGQLAAVDESLRATAQAEADAASQTAFNQARNISAPSTQYLLGTSGAGQQGQASVSQAPAVSQSFGEMFNPERGVDIANINTQNMLNRNIAQANIDAQDRASRGSMFGNVVGAFSPIKIPGIN